MSKKATAKHPAGQRSNTWLWLLLLTLAVFFAVFYSSAEAIKTTAMILMPAAVLLGCFRFRALRQRTHLPLIALFLLVLMTGISTSYALSGKFALSESLKHICAFCVGLSLLAVVSGEGIAPGRRFAAVLEGVGALCALFSVDLISTRLISTPLLFGLGGHISLYRSVTGVEEGVRMTSIFANPNVFAGSVGICVLLALGLALSSANRKERLFHLCCLFITSTAFVLAFSMGATAAIAIAFIAYLLLEQKGKKMELFVLMVETLILAVLAAALISSVAFDAWDGIQPIPLLCLVVGAAALCAADTFVGQKIVPVLSRHRKLFLTVLVVLVAAAALFLFAAFWLTGGVNLECSESLHRTAYPAAGHYTLTAEDGEVISVTVETQNQQDTMMHTRTVLFDGPLSSAAFTVPEDSLVVHFTFRTEQAARLTSVSFVGQDGSTEKIPLGYKLLPNFIVNRLQGLWANQNAIQRLVFFRDGIKLAGDSPLYGLGIGAFENAIQRVQEFHYETKYAHNHYIQVLLEMGIIGLFLFVGLLGVCAAVILIARKKADCHPLTAALGAVLAFMAVHSATEVVFSSFYYLPFAYGAFVLINLCCKDAIPFRRAGKAVQTAALAAAAVFLIVFTFLLNKNISARRLVEKQQTLNALDVAIEMDPFEWTDHALSFVLSAMNSTNEDVLKQADRYAARLAEVNSNVLPLYLTRYYLQQGNVERGMEMAEKYGRYLSSSSDAWNSLFEALSAYAQPTDTYRAGLKRIVEIMETWDNEHMGTIELTPENRAFLTAALAK